MPEQETIERAREDKREGKSVRKWNTFAKANMARDLANKR